MPVYPRCGVRPVRGEHCHLIDEDGTRYLDFASGIAVNLLGHSHEGLIGAIQQQAATLMHVSNLYGSPQGEKLAQALVDTTFGDTVFFTNSGAEAVECAIKAARAYHQNAGEAGDSSRFEIITFHNAFHGRTMATISASNQTKMHHGFAPLLDGFKYAPFDDLEAAKALIGPKTAGILVEPIQGEGGIRPASQEFMTGLRQLCDEHDLMLVLDEVQCGVARTGKLYAYEHYGITPDIMAIAKGIGGGFPMGACLSTREAGKVLLEAEATLYSLAPGRGTALRFAGLYGPDRLPRLDDLKAGRPSAADPESWLNLIHVDDAAAIVCSVGAAPTPRPLYVVSDGVPVRRRDWYAHLAKVSCSPPPTWDPSAPRTRGADKRVDPSLLFSDIPITLAYRDSFRGIDAILQ
jgi:hypothetical protein